MHQARSAPAQVSPPTRLARLRWWTDAFVVCVLCLLAGLAELVVNGRVDVAVALFAILVVAGSHSARARQEFRRAWRQGYETAARVVVERSAGRITDVEVRAAVDGDPIPEPWDRHVPPRLVRSPR
ncbi:MAG: hypothetical protein HGA44_01905 [Cellulomonadaceae bacterium]|nr:hypothetical protein [Cellulomonadaceae bacterium]